MNKSIRHKLTILAFILPALTVYVLIVFYPILQTLQRSFYSWDGISAPIFNGIKNYTRMIDDPDFLISLKNGLLFSGVLFVYQIGVGTLLALLLSGSRLKGRRFFKTSFFVPVVLSSTVTAQLWVNIYDQNNGLINKALELLHIPLRQNFLGSFDWGILAIAFVNAWQFMGYTLVLLYAGIRTIPAHLYEAAMIDGANSFTAHRKITIPLLSEVYKICFIFAITGGLKAFAEMFIMTGGGPGNANFTLSIMMYKAAFRLNEYGYGCAISIILVLECLIAMLFINKVFSRNQG